MLSLLAIAVFIYLTGNGSQVMINITTQSPVMLVNITLPVQPLGPITVVNSTGQLIPFYVRGNQLYTTTVGPGNITITYTPYIDTLSNGTLQLQVNTDYETQIFMANNVLPTSIPINIQNFQVTGNGAIITLAPGNYTINFIITGQVNTTKASTTQQPVRTATTQPVPFSTLDYVIVIVIVVLLLSILLIIRRRR
ncbi:hypothetical protein [Vulcanisaeta sp. JCM 16159]|uniref:hypothetical protein n=1 Tax=Vulcanisaeta sp. JCM 16159 TaxID=1295371 RepID=UPI0006CF958F|nr:hypothetical protein [Vulcanisaeta sp. JCM 16159]